MILQGPRTYTLVKVESDAGLHGIGEAYGSPGVGVKEGILALKPELIGKDPLGIDALMTGLGWRTDGSAHMLIRAVSGIEMALWDLAGKTLGVPTTTLLGGKFRDRVRMYDHSAPRDMMDPASCREWADRVKSDPSGFTIHKFGFEHTDPRTDPRAIGRTACSRPPSLRGFAAGSRTAARHSAGTTTSWSTVTGSMTSEPRSSSPRRSSRSGRSGSRTRCLLNMPRAGGGSSPARRFRSARAKTSAGGRDSRISSSTRDVTSSIPTCATRADSWRPSGSPTLPRCSACRWRRTIRAASSIPSRRRTGPARSAIFWPRRPLLGTGTGWTTSSSTRDRVIKEGIIQPSDRPGLGLELNPDVVKAHLAPGETYWDHRCRSYWAVMLEFLDWPGVSQYDGRWLGRPGTVFLANSDSTTLLQTPPSTVETLGLSRSRPSAGASGEKRGSRRERIAPLILAHSHALACAGSWFVASLCLAAWLGLQAWHGFVLRAGRARAQQPAAEPVGAVDENDLLKAGSNDANWLMYGRTYNGQRYSSLNQINTKNVARLIPVWTFQTGVLDGFECTPLVIDGIMYVTTPWNHAYAIDCKTGSQLWHYQKSLPENLALCCDAVNRGFAAWGDRLYMATLDAHLVCLDRNTGEEVWDMPITVPGEDGKEVGDIYKMAYSATVAPLVVKGKVIIGISGAEYGIRGFIDAYDAKTGKRLWRFLHGSRRRRQVGTCPEGPGDLGRQYLADRRRLGLGHRHLRPRAQHPVLGHRQPLARLQRRRAQGRQPLHLLDPRPQPRRWLIQVAFSEQPP